jgi:hypothetical protein
MIVLNIIALEDFSLSTGLQCLELEIGQKVSVQFESLAQAKSFQNMELLTILDDEADAAKMIQKLLTKRKSQIQKIRTVQEALQSKETISNVLNTPDIVEDLDDIQSILDSADESEAFQLSQDLSIPENEISVLDIDQAIVEKASQSDDDYLPDIDIEQDEDTNDNGCLNKDELRALLESSEDEDALDTKDIPVMGKLDRRKKYWCQKCDKQEMEALDRDDDNNLLILNCPKCNSMYSLEFK